MIEKISDSPWATNKNVDPFHSLCSYLGAFPPSLANYFIKNFSKENDLVLDPFSGRGTTLFEARMLNRNSIASDVNPIALALSKAKSKNINPDYVIERIGELEDNYDYALFMSEAKAQPDEIHLIFHPRTLAQLCYLKMVLLNTEDPIDQFLVGAVLGIMHGGERKDGTSGYASISMPNTFSMSPEYVRKFVQTKQLNREYRNVFDLLREKVNRNFKNHAFPKTESTVVEADAKNLSGNSILSDYIGKVDLLLTSPPYLGVVNYARQNWIRSWFLDSNPESISELLDDDLNIFEWIQFSKKTLAEFKKFLKPDGVAIFVIGDVAKSKNNVIPLAREFVTMNNENNFFKNAWVFSDRIKEMGKTTRIWGSTKGRATAIDRIVILSDVNPFEKESGEDKDSILTFEQIEESTRDFLGNVG